jgi:hypothetical protein
MTDLCPHDDIAAACLDCLDGKPPERPNAEPDHPVAGARPFYAQHPGHCNGCNLAIYTHEKIVWMTNDEYWHERCATA